MTLDEALVIVDNLLQPKRLNQVQQIVSSQSWLGQTYQEIAIASGYDHDYIKEVGSGLWTSLSEVPSCCAFNLQ